MNRIRQPVSLEQAMSDAPVLARLSQLTQTSSQYLRWIVPLLPDGLQSAVQAGPLDGQSWCLLVQGNAAAAKLRQLIPAIQSRLQERGATVENIRVKVHAHRT